MADNYKELFRNSLYYGMTFNERLKYYKIPAISLALIKAGKVDYTYCYGLKDRDTEEAVTEETLFQAGSISKSVFAAAVMCLVQKEQIDLDKDINDYIDTSFYRTYDNQKHVITLRQLLSHTAGFNLHGFSGYQYGQQIPTLDQILKGDEPANNLPLFLKSEPGKEWKYSGGGYLLAQKVVCNECNADIETIVQNEIFHPLGMLHSTYQQPVRKDKKYNIACGYNYYNLKLPDNCNTMPELAAAGLWTTPGDLSLFGIELMKAYKGKSQFISKNTMHLMLTKYIPNMPAGLGLFFPDDNPKGYFKHSGDNIGYHSIMCFQSENGNGYAAMINSDIGAEFLTELNETLSKNMNMSI